MSTLDRDGLAHSLTPSVSGEQVEAYLRRYPDFLRTFLPTFLAEHPEITYLSLADTLPERPLGDGVEDFQAHALRHLRREADTLRSAVQELIYNAENSLDLQNRTQQAVLVALSATSFDDLARIVSDEFPSLLDIDSAMLCFEAGLPKAAAVYVQEIPHGGVNHLLGEDHMAALRPVVESEPLLYGSQEGAVRSDALVRLMLPPTLPPGLLILGSRQEETFYPEQATDLLQFLANVVAQCVARWVAP